MAESDKKRLEEIINQARKFGEAKFDWVNDTDIDQTKEKQKLDIQQAGSATDVAKKATEKTATDVNKKEEEKVYSPEVIAAADKLGKKREEIGGEEIQKYREIKTKEDEEAKKTFAKVAGLIIGIGVAESTGSPAAGNYVYNKVALDKKDKGHFPGDDFYS